jgi:hypothetical protein
MNKKVSKRMSKVLKNILLIGFAPVVMLLSSQSMAVDMYQYSAGTGPDATTTDSYIVDNHDTNNNYYYLNAASGLFENIYGNTFNGATDILTVYDGSTHDVFSAAAEAASYFDYQMWVDDNPDAGSTATDTTGDTTGSTTTSAGAVSYNADDITGTIANIQNTAIAVMGALITLGLTVMFYRKIRGLASRG